MIQNRDDLLNAKRTELETSVFSTGIARTDAQQAMLHNELAIVRLFAAPPEAFNQKPNDPDWEVRNNPVDNFVCSPNTQLYLLPEKQQEGVIVAQGRQGDQFGILVYNPEVRGELKPKVVIGYRNSTVSDNGTMVPLIHGKFPDNLHTSGTQYTTIWGRQRMDKIFTITEVTPLLINNAADPHSLVLDVLGTENVPPAIPLCAHRGAHLGTPVPTHQRLKSSDARLSGRNYPLTYRIETI